MEPNEIDICEMKIECVDVHWIPQIQMKNDIDDHHFVTHNSDSTFILRLSENKESKSSMDERLIEKRFGFI